MSNNSNMQNSIAKLLDGVVVKWKPLGEVAEIYGGLTGKIKADFENGNMPYISYKNIFDNIEVNFNELETVQIADSENQHEVKYGDVLFTGSSETADEAGISSVVTTKFKDKVYLNSFSFALRFNDGIEILPEFSKYLFRSHFMRCEISKTASGVTRFNISKMRFKKIQIPIPPLHIQTEIVRILDKFTALTAELTAELTARKKQYNYYRDKLLTFKENEVEWKTVEEIFYLKNGYTPSKSESKFWENGDIPWFRMEDIRENGRVLNDALQKINKIAVKGGKLFSENSIIISTSATIGEHALVTVSYLSNQRFTNISLKEEYQDHFDIKFVFYYCFILCNWCKKNTTVSNFSSVDMNGFKKFKFPIPPLKEQARIVEILDKFDALTNSITEGLPREIALRQKQYEYYRNLLLDFPKVQES
ncbi:MAG: restriction endonuclease subunit S [Apibacter sp.]|nr:restriction endonuclease subunit S [Apibacter sp.]